MIKIICLLFTYLLFSEMSLAQHVQYLTPQVIDFGLVKEDSLLQGNILFVNTGSTPVTIRSVRTSCGCTVAQVIKKESAPGDTMNISFSFNTKGFDGLVRKSVSILFQENDIEDANFVIQANIIQDIVVHPKSYQFTINGSNPDSMITDMLTIHNYWNHPLQINGIHAVNDIITVTPMSTVIQSGESEQIKLQFNLSQIQQRYITLTIETDHNKNPKILVPVLINVKD